MAAKKPKKTSPKHKTTTHKKTVHKHVAKPAADGAVPPVIPEAAMPMEAVSPVVDTTTPPSTPIVYPVVPVDDQSGASTIQNDAAAPIPAPLTQVRADGNPQITQETMGTEQVIQKEGELMSGVADQSVVETEPRKYGKIIAIAGFILLLAVLFGGVLIYTKSMGQLSQTQEKKEPVVALPTKAPSPTAIGIDKTKYVVKVLNGSDITGLAAKVQAGLEDDGFKVGSIGNGDKSTYTKTVIAVKHSVESAYVDELKTALSKTYTVDEVTYLEVTAKDDIVVTVGSEKAE